MLLKARPYQGFGGTIHDGKTHQLDDSESKTLCGKTRQNCPGDLLAEGFGEVDCKGCLNSIESRKKREEWEIAFRQRAIEKQQQDAQWWERYDNYLLSNGWRKRRALVMGRANNLCEGCGTRRATQVHHLTYTHVFNEFLWELVALCDECHSRVHDRTAAAGVSDEPF
jgi:5-methylcytosine-specific restriction endonuclease McrA